MLGAVKKEFSRHQHHWHGCSADVWQSNSSLGGCHLLKHLAECGLVLFAGPSASGSSLVCPGTGFPATTLGARENKKVSVIKKAAHLAFFSVFI